MQQPKIIATPEYEKRISKLLPTEDRNEAENHIASNPEAHPVIPGTNAMAKKSKSPVSRYLSKIGKKGGQVKGVAKGLAALSPEEREEIRAKALATRRKNAAKKKDSK
jgi:hypothetical protein